MYKILTTKGQSGLTMIFKSYGSGKRVFVLLHGIPGSSQSWQKVADELASGDTRVLVPDLIGFGRSSRSSLISDLWIESQAQALRDGLNQLGVEFLHLVGHDYGGPISITLYGLLSERIQSLTLLATNTFTDTPIPPPLALIKLPIVGSYWSKVIFSRASLGMMLKQGVGRKNTQIDATHAIGDQSQAGAIATIFGSALRDLSTRYKSVEQALPKIKVPTKVIWGTKDPFFSLKQGERTARSIPGASLITLGGAGHFLPDECSKEVVSELQKWS